MRNKMLELMQFRKRKEEAYSRRGFKLRSRLIIYKGHNFNVVAVMVKLSI